MECPDSLMLNCASVENSCFSLKLWYNTLYEVKRNQNLPSELLVAGLALDKTVVLGPELTLLRLRRLHGRPLFPGTSLFGTDLP